MCRWSFLVGSWSLVFVCLSSAVRSWTFRISQRDILFSGPWSRWASHDGRTWRGTRKVLPRDILGTFTMHPSWDLHAIFITPSRGIRGPFTEPARHFHVTVSELSNYDALLHSFNCTIIIWEDQLVETLRNCRLPLVFCDWHQVLGRRPFVCCPWPRAVCLWPLIFDLWSLVLGGGPKSLVVGLRFVCLWSLAFGLWV